MSCTKLIICTNLFSPGNNPRGRYNYLGFIDKDLYRRFERPRNLSKLTEWDLNPDLPDAKAQAYGLLVFCVFKPCVLCLQDASHLFDFPVKPHLNFYQNSPGPNLLTFNTLAALKLHWRDGLKMQETASSLQVMSEKCP